MTNNFVQDHLESLQEGKDKVCEVKPVPGIVQESLLYPFLEIDSNIPVKHATPPTQVLLYPFVLCYVLVALMFLFRPCCTFRGRRGKTPNSSTGSKGG